MTKADEIAEKHLQAWADEDCRHILDHMQSALAEFGEWAAQQAEDGPCGDEPEDIAARIRAGFTEGQ